MPRPIHDAGALAKSITLYRRGVICPAEMWRKIVESLPPDGDTAPLDALRDDLREVLLGAFVERPHSLWGVVEEGRGPGSGEVERWCLESLARRPRTGGDRRSPCN